MITFANGIICATTEQPPLDDWRAAMIATIAATAPGSPDVRAIMLANLDYRGELAAWRAFVDEVEGGR
jgi:pyridoxine/pyridoxamine 5'-phosphate oxidase